MNKYNNKSSYKTALKKLLLGQFGAAMLGIMTSMPTISLSGDNRYGDLLGLATTVLAVVFLLYIQYTAMWDIGAKDKLAIDGGRMKEDIYFGAKAAVFASIPTFILTFLSIVFKSLYLITKVKVFGDIFNISYAVDLIWNYMYHGILMIFSPGPDTVESWISLPYLALFFFLTVPSIVFRYLAYRMGLKGKRLFPERKKD